VPEGRLLTGGMLGRMPTMVGRNADRAVGSGHNIDYSHSLLPSEVANIFQFLLICLTVFCQTSTPLSIFVIINYSQLA